MGVGCSGREDGSELALARLGSDAAMEYGRIKTMRAWGVRGRAARAKAVEGNTSKR